MPLTFTQIQHLSRNIKQRLKKVPIAVVGGYHGGNVGDMGLGESVIKQLDFFHLKGGLQTIYNLEKWPSTSYAIMGGGSIGYVDQLRRLINRYKEDLSHVAILGMDFPEGIFPEDCLDLFRNAAFVSCRNQDQAEWLQYLTSREDISFHPDIAFSLHRNLCKEVREERSAGSQKKKLMVNAMPLFAFVKNGKIVPNEFYKTERPELYTNFEQMHHAYKNFLRTQVEKAIEENYEVETIDFSPADTLYGRLILQGLPVKHFAYSSNPNKMMRRMAKADSVIATRFHATIYALKMGVTLIPVGLSEKNERLLDALGIPNDQYLTTKNLAMGKDQIDGPINYDFSTIENWETEAEEAIRNCIRSLKISIK